MGKIVSKITQGLGLTADPNAGAAAMQQSMEMQRQAMEELKKVAPSDYAKLEELARKASVVMPEFVGELEAQELNSDDLLSVFNSPAFQKMAESEEGIEAELDNIIDQGGMTEEMRSDYRKFQDQATAQAQAEQKSITQQAMQQGRSGSGVELAQQIASNQASAQRRSQAAQQMAGAAQNSKLAALQNKAALSGQQGQRGIQQADARRNIEQFNALQRTQSNQANMARRQGLADMASGQQRQMYGQLAGIEGQKFGESMQKAGGVASGMQNYGNALAQQAGMQAQGAQAQAAGNMALVGAGVKAYAAGAADGGVKYARGGVNYFGGTPSQDFLIAQREKDAASLDRLNALRESGQASNNPMLNVRRSPNPEGQQMLENIGTGIKNFFSGDTREEFKPSKDDYSQAFDESNKPENEGKSPERLKAELEGAKKEKGSAAGAFGDALMASGLKGMQQDMMPKRQNINLQQKTQSFNPLQGMAAADGGVRRPEEVMADIQGLMSQEPKAYADGGISPELVAATQMLRTNNQPAPGAPMPGGQPPMPQEAPPMPPQGMPMPPQGMPPQAAPMPPQQPPMPPQGMPQGQAMADGGMAYEDGGEGTIIDSGMDMYEGDQLPDRINDGEMVLNVEQQDRLNDALMELKRLKSRERTDKMLAKGEIEANPMQQESLMSFVRGEIDIDEVPNERVVKEPSVGEPSGRMAELLGMVSKKRRG